MTDYGGLSYPAVCPYIFYEDTAAAMNFLERAFGFRERLVSKNDDGTVSHVEMERGNAVVMMGSPPNLKSPKRLGQVTVGMYVHVDDVDELYEQAKAARPSIRDTALTRISWVFAHDDPRNPCRRGDTRTRSTTSRPRCRIWRERPQTRPQLD